MNSLAILSTKVDDMKESLVNLADLTKDQFEELKERMDHTNGKVRKLEIWWSWLTGFSVCLSIVVIPLLIYIWQNHFATTAIAHHP